MAVTLVRPSPMIRNVQHTRAVDSRGLEAELRRHLEGEVRFDAGSKAIYSVDASNYRQVPIGVVIPRTIEDVAATVKVARAFDAPVLSRGGGTSLAGQCCNAAIVMDWTKYLNQILEVDPARRIARVRPGCVLDKLRNAANQYGLTFGPDPATHDHCTLGGMLGNNSCGIHAQMAGATSNNVESLEVLLYDGTRMSLGWTTDAEMQHSIEQGGRAGEILSQLLSLRSRYAAQITKRFPPIPRRVSGYNLDQLLPSAVDGRINLARALVGSEGTLVTILEATLKLIHNPPYQVLVVLGYPDVYAAGDDIPEILKFQPMGLEGLDRTLIESMKKKHLHTDDLGRLPEGDGWLLVQLPGETKEEADQRAHQLAEQLKKRRRPPSIRIYDDPGDEKPIWEVRESGLGATAFVPGEPLSWPGWEDAAVPPEVIGDYLRDFKKLMNKFGYNAALYGHFGMGCVHCRITFDVMSKRGIRQYRSFVTEAAELVVSYGGSLSGEHGDGQSRGELLPIMFGKEIIEAFREYKTIWDPDWKMNPGKIVDPYPLDSNLRLGANYHPSNPKTHFKFPDDDGKFADAALRCVGVGKCRREGSDTPEDQTMCPSFMATHEEKHSTRGRARLLWEMLQGSVIRDGWRDENVKEALDLCLSCKGCKSDCPLNVDMATYKAEFLSHYYAGRMRPRSAYAFGWIDKWAELAALWPGLVNLAASIPGIRELIKTAAGLSPRRTIPEFASQTFQAWFAARAPRNTGKPKVVLFPDTFNNHFFPHTAQAAVEVLEHAGFHVEVPTGHVCCGRPLYDYGFLTMAQQYLRRLMRIFEPYMQTGTPIILLEPSCWSVLRDEIHGLFPERKETRWIAENIYLLSEFLTRKTDYRPPQFRRSAILHRHCHHKSILHGATHEEQLLQKMQMNVTSLTNGCCGMAGSFGFEQDHYDISAAVGEHALLPSVRQAGFDELIVADGFSCREQISQMTSRHALHVAEVLQLALREPQKTAFHAYPEQEIVKEHREAIRKSKVEALKVLGGASAAVAATLIALRATRRLGRPMAGL